MIDFIHSVFQLILGLFVLRTIQVYLVQHDKDGPSTNALAFLLH